MFGAFRRTLAEVEELNMIPVMNLFMVLIPFLLAGAAFYQVAVIPTSTPQHTPDASDVPSDPQMLSVNVLLATDGALSLSASHATLPPDEVAALATRLAPAPGGGHDKARLQARLAELKAAYPRSETAFVVAEDGVQVQALVEVVDAIRERTGPDGRPEALLPVIVLSQLVPGAGAAEGEDEPIVLEPDDGLDEAPAEEAP